MVSTKKEGHYLKATIYVRCNQFCSLVVVFPWRLCLCYGYHDILTTGNTLNDTQKKELSTNNNVVEVEIEVLPVTIMLKFTPEISYVV